MSLFLVPSPPPTPALAPGSPSCWQPLHFSKPGYQFKDFGGWEEANGLRRAGALPVVGERVVLITRDSYQVPTSLAHTSRAGVLGKQTRAGQDPTR